MIRGEGRRRRRENEHSQQLNVSLPNKVVMCV